MGLTLGNWVKIMSKVHHYVMSKGANITVTAEADYSVTFCHKWHCLLQVALFPSSLLVGLTLANWLKVMSKVHHNAMGKGANITRDAGATAVCVRKLQCM